MSVNADLASAVFYFLVYLQPGDRTKRIKLSFTNKWGELCYITTQDRKNFATNVRFCVPYMPTNTIVAMCMERTWCFRLIIRVRV